MEQSSQELSPKLTPPHKSTLTGTRGAENPTNSAQTAGCGGGSLSIEQAAAATEAAVPATTKSLPKNTKKRKPNASGPKRTSVAWDHFIKLGENEAKEPTAACKYCGKKYLADTKQHGASNLLSHLKNCPKYLSAIINDPNQTTISFKSVEGGSLGTASYRFNLEACWKALALFVTVDEQPFMVVEGEGFKHLCRQLQPQFTLPSRRTVARDCFQMYLDEKLRLNAYFRSDCNRVALTTDCWTSVQNLNYMTLTAHFIDNEWKYQKRIISFSLVPNHKGETIGRKIEEVLRDWGLRNVSTIIVDNASSNDVAVAYLKKRIKNMNGLMVDGEFFHMRCCAHILNLVVNDGLKDMHSSIDSIRKAVRFVRSSPQRSAKFKECIEFSRITCKKLVCLDVPTRWNSTYMMLDAAEKFQVAFEKLEDEDSSYVEFFGPAGPPNTIDWENVRAFGNFLKIFYEATKVFLSSQQVSLHHAFHQLAFILCELKKSSMNLNTVLATMSFEMKRKYHRYWGSVVNINQFLYFGVIFHPLYKLRYVNWSFRDMYRDEPIFANQLSTTLKNNLFKMYNWYKVAYDQQDSSGQPVGQIEGVSHGEGPYLGEAPSQFARAKAFKQHLREEDSIDKKNELERYVSEPCIDEGDKFEILGWWKNNSVRYPILSTIVRDLMVTPVSTVASESAFSTGGRVLDTFRSSLNPAMAEALICVQNWLRPSFSQFKDLNLNEEFVISENIVTKFQGGSTNFGGAGGVRTGVGFAGGCGPSTQSQPTGCD